MSAFPPPVVKQLGTVDYEPTWRAMQTFTEERGPDSPDELWLLEHPPVFTLGLNASQEHVLAPGGIPLVPIDRGGQVTYHGPGQLVMYVLIDLKRRNLGVRRLVTLVEQSMIGLLADFGIEAAARPEAPGVYVEGRKIGSVGLRVRRGCSYHGLSLNVDMDLEPFRRINPCGYPGLEMTQLRDFGVTASPTEIGPALAERFIDGLAQQPASAVT